MTEPKKIDKYIKTHGCITSYDSHKIGITQFHRAIKDCRERNGMNIEDDWVLKPNGAKYYKKYFYKQINFDDIREKTT